MDLEAIKKDLQCYGENIMDLEAIKKDLLNFENSLEYQLFHLNFALIYHLLRILFQRRSATESF